MFRKILTGIASIFVLASLLREKKPEAEVEELQEFDLKPGVWFQTYLVDWMIAHEVSQRADVPSGMAQGALSGAYIWLTATPEWDREWFNAHGWKFPSRWVPFTYLDYSTGQPGETCKLPGL